MRLFVAEMTGRDRSCGAPAFSRLVIIGEGGLNAFGRKKLLQLQSVHRSFLPSWDPSGIISEGAIDGVIQIGRSDDGLLPEGKNDGSFYWSRLPCRFEDIFTLE